MSILNMVNTLIFFAEKNVSSFCIALQKLLIFLLQKNQCI